MTLISCPSKPSVAVSNVDPNKSWPYNQQNGLNIPHQTGSYDSGWDSSLGFSLDSVSPLILTPSQSPVSSLDEWDLCGFSSSPENVPNAFLGPSNFHVSPPHPVGNSVAISTKNQATSTGQTDSAWYPPAIVEAPKPFPSRPETNSETRIVMYDPTHPAKGRVKKGTSAKRVNALSREPKFKVTRQDNGAVQGVYHVFGSDERIRSRFSQRDREATRMTRHRGGACERCRIHKKRCDVPSDNFEPCPACSKLPRERLQQPCLRISICELKIHRLGSTINNALDSWIARTNQLTVINPQRQSRIVTITQREGSQGIVFPVRIKSFSPEIDDVTWWNWRDEKSEERKMDMPPYYICDVEHATEKMKEAIYAGRKRYIGSLLLQKGKEMPRKTFNAAFRHVERTKNTLVDNALTFWVAARFIEWPWHLHAGFIPGFDPPNEPACPFNNMTPVTPIMDTQIDDIALRHLMIPLADKILKELDLKIRANNREEWFEVYLTMFILMNHFEFVFSDIIDYTARHGMQTSTTSGSSLSSAYFVACKTILVYFHFACRGYGPFSANWTAPHTNLDTRPFYEQEYLRDIYGDVQRQKSSKMEWQGCSMYVTPMYWCNQLLCPDWTPNADLNQPFDGYTEQDFLTS